METVSSETTESSLSKSMPGGDFSRNFSESPTHCTGACLSPLPFLSGLRFFSWLIEGRCSTGISCISNRARPDINFWANSWALNCFTFWRFKGPLHSPTCSTRSDEGGSCRKHHALEHAAHWEHRAMSVRHPLSVEVLKEECKIFLFASHRCAEALKDSSAGISSLAHSCQSRLLFPPARFNLAKCLWYSVGV